MGILICVFCVAIFTDWQFYKIPNLCIAVGICGGLIMTYVSYGAASLVQAIIQLFIIFAAFYPFYLIKGIGAGDVKLFMMTACYIQGSRLIDYMLVSMLLAAMAAILKMLLYRESRERLLYLIGYIKKLVITGAADEYVIDKREKKSVIRLSIPAFISLMLMQTGVY